MQKSNLVLRMVVVLALAVSISLCIHPSTRAQNQVCHWQKTEEIPRTIVSSTAPEAISTLSGSVVVISYKKLLTTHTWTAPGSILTPGEDILYDVTVSWDYDSDLVITGGLRTYMSFGGVDPISAARSKINFDKEKTGSVSASEYRKVPAGSKAGARYTITAFADAAVAGGRVDYIYTYVCQDLPPTPSQTAAATLTAVPSPTVTQTPQACPDLTDDEKLMKILDIYFERIPKGITTSGEKNNIYDAMGYTGYGEFVCGGYQSKVLNLLNGLKFSKDPCERELLEKWDYAPIQAWWGYHQAVVIYPWATNWMETGLVLDPWIDQTPKVYEVADWAVHFSASGVVPIVGTLPEKAIGGSYIGIGPSEEYRSAGNYPVFNGDYQAEGDNKLTQQENAYIKTLPDDKQELFKKLPRVNQKQWLEMKLAGVEKVQKAVVHCPLNAYLEDAKGARSGIKGGQVFNELPLVSFSAFPLTDGTNYSELLYPENAGYTLFLEGTDAGSAYVVISEALSLNTPSTAAQKYNFQVKDAVIYQISTQNLGAPMQWQGVAIQPVSITENASIDWIDSLPGLSPIKSLSDQAAPSLTRTEWRIKNYVGMVILLIGLMSTGISTAVLVTRATNRKKWGSVQPSGQPQPWVEGMFLAAILILGMIILAVGSIGLWNHSKNNPDALIGSLPKGTVHAPQIFGSPVPSIQTTAQIVSTAPATPSYTPTVMSTVTPPATQTVMAQPSPTRTLTPPPAPSATPATGTYFDDHSLRDDFSSRVLDWEERNDGSTILMIENGVYRFQHKDKDSFDATYLPVNIYPSEIQFDVRALQGSDDGTFGLFCHMQDTKNYYYVEIDLFTQTYLIAQSLNGEFVPLTKPNDRGHNWQPASALNPPESGNHISIGCYLGSIQLVINDEFTDEVTVSQPFKKKGRTALFIYTYSFAGVDGYQVFFDNFEAYEPMQ